MSAQDLPVDIGEKEVELGKAYQQSIKANDYPQAEKMLLAMWDIYPQPKHLWSSSKSLIKDIIGFYMEQKNYSSAESWVDELFRCNLLPNDPKPHIIRGKVYFESGRKDMAAQEFLKAYEMGGRRGYVGEDPKYLQFALSRQKR
ncbi:hypothetical protein [Xanthomonas rydalmerensis]|uniref:Tetratricopeptide repeat protein n=1 Tax=Xanthomonas rydalmerensis TaxID=3046274 RepID=A0ABZ0JSC6_9XANT|nr:hypothetical protein [Xanthomonas sp. DM-2023]WOS42711.1 hypothetical protein QN243_09845 [Xanthomonas sp. DM-2023]WOS46897.1 hypothetical protein QN242_09845 [Xanthomonas sp. DM-2023]WOS51076.1 hypothetical protein QN240_09845 [Xanthomonas sp. DM-2023]WOS55257.1 hypothetical protein QN244_09845 [Xanthomonas sp. DM-2023]WOS59439.1 hypothetical protein QN245_09845 [Xanthomonas sp. DM-2023]